MTTPHLFLNLLLKGFLERSELPDPIAPFQSPGSGVLHFLCLPWSLSSGAVMKSLGLCLHLSSLSLLHSPKSQFPLNICGSLLLFLSSISFVDLISRFQ